jgi:catechol 2,3-dioxygenase-like lactoylglutathione lyase family enzyme
MGLLHTSIRVRDLKKSIPFYKKLGMKVIDKKVHVPGMTVVTLGSDDTEQKLRLNHYTKGCEYYTPYVLEGVELDNLMFKVPDAKKLFNKLVKGGAPIASPLFENENVAAGYVKDPDHIWIGLITRKNEKKR